MGNKQEPNSFYSVDLFMECLKIRFCLCSKGVRGAPGDIGETGKLGEVVS